MGQPEPELLTQLALVNDIVAAKLLIENLMAVGEPFAVNPGPAHWELWTTEAGAEAFMKVAPGPPRRRAR